MRFFFFLLKVVFFQLLMFLIGPEYALMRIINIHLEWKVIS